MWKRISAQKAAADDGDAKKTFYDGGTHRNTRKRRKRGCEGRAPPVTSYDFEENIVLERNDANDIANGDNGDSAARCTILASEIAALRKIGQIRWEECDLYREAYQESGRSRRTQ